VGIVMSRGVSGLSGGQRGEAHRSWTSIRQAFRAFSFCAPLCLGGAATLLPSGPTCHFIGRPSRRHLLHPRWAMATVVCECSENSSVENVTCPVPRK
jgi:hypothetical protein